MLAKEKYEQRYHDFVGKIMNEDIYMAPCNIDWQKIAARRIKMLRDFFRWHWKSIGNMCGPFSVIRNSPYGKSKRLRTFGTRGISAFELVAFYRGFLFSSDVFFFLFFWSLQEKFKKFPAKIAFATTVTSQTLGSDHNTTHAMTIYGLKEKQIPAFLAEISQTACREFVFSSLLVERDSLISFRGSPPKDRTFVRERVNENFPSYPTLFPQRQSFQEYVRYNLPHLLQEAPKPSESEPDTCTGDVVCPSFDNLFLERSQPEEETVQTDVWDSI